MEENETYNSGTLQAISDKVGLSTSTVWRVLNNSPRVSPKTRQMVLKALNGQRRLRGRHAGPVVIGVDVPSFNESRLDNAYFQEMFAGLLQSAKSYNTACRPVEIASERRPGEPFTELIMRLGLEGLIHITLPKRSVPMVREIAEAGFPQYIIGGRANIPNVNWSESENVESTQRGVQYLIGLGHRRIGVIMPQPHRTHEERLEGYRRALENAGMEIDPELILERRHSNLDSGIRATTDLMTRPDRPTAIYYADTEMAIGGIRAARQMDLKVPGDLSILAIGDFRFAEYITPKLSLIRQPVFDMAKRAGSVLAEQVMHKDNEIHQELVSCDLFINDTTGSVNTK